jgi:acetyl esterase/lipase
MASVSPLELLDGKTRYPPTAFLQETTDSIIPISQSMEMTERLRKMGVAVVGCYLPGVNYWFDSTYTVSTQKVVADCT